VLICTHVIGTLIGLACHNYKVLLLKDMRLWVVLVLLTFAFSVIKFNRDDFNLLIICVTTCNNFYLYKYLFLI